MAMAERKNIEFGVEGGVTLRGWLFLPGAKGLAPAITMAHGYAGVKEHGLERFARAFADAERTARPSRHPRQQRFAFSDSRCPA